MPIYEYECKACGDIAEVMQKMSDPAPEACPACHKGPLVKIMSRTAFVLKGEGWYVTDFRDKKKPAAKPDDKAAPQKAEGTTTSTDAKAPESAAKAEPVKAEAPAAKAVDKPASS